MNGNQDPDSSATPVSEFTAVEVSAPDADTRRIIGYRSDLGLRQRRDMFERIARKQEPGGSPDRRGAPRANTDQAYVATETVTPDTGVRRITLRAARREQPGTEGA